MGVQPVKILFRRPLMFEPDPRQFQHARPEAPPESGPVVHEIRRDQDAARTQDGADAGDAIGLGKGFRLD